MHADTLRTFGKITINTQEGLAATDVGHGNALLIDCCVLKCCSLWMRNSGRVMLLKRIARTKNIKEAKEEFNYTNPL